MSSSFNNILWLSTAVVAGILSAAGLFLLTHIVTETHSHNKDDPEALRLQIVSLQQELENLRELQRKNAPKKKRHRLNYLQNHSTMSDTESVDYRSVMGTDVESDDEYYDLMDSEEDVSLDAMQSFINILENVDRLLSGSDSDVKEAYESLLNLKETKKLLSVSELAEVSWRLCRCCQRMVSVCEKNNDDERRRDIIDEGIEHGKEALACGPDNFNAHKWYAVIVGLRSKNKGPADRINDGNTYLHHIKMAIDLKPDDAVLHHLRGRFKFEIASLSWFERKAAAAIFRDMPSADYDGALVDFETAERLARNDWKENRLYIGKCQIGKKNYAEGARWLRSAVEIAPVTADDHAVDAEAKEMLEKCG